MHKCNTMHNIINNTLFAFVNEASHARHEINAKHNNLLIVLVYLLTQEKCNDHKKW